MIFLIISVIAFNLILLLVPKKLNKKDLYIVFYFSLMLGFISDITLDLIYHIYGYFEPGPQLVGLLPNLGLFPASGTLFINFYPFQSYIISKILYIIIWSSFCLLYEFAAVASGFFYHNDWTYLYSLFAYPSLLVLIVLHYNWFTKYLK